MLHLAMVACDFTSIEYLLSADLKVVIMPDDGPESRFKFLNHQVNISYDFLVPQSLEVVSFDTYEELKDLPRTDNQVEQRWNKYGQVIGRRLWTTDKTVSKIG